MFGSHLLVEIMPCVLAAAAFFWCLLCTTSLQHVLGRTGVAAGGVFSHSHLHIKLVQLRIKNSEQSKVQAKKPESSLTKGG